MLCNKVTNIDIGAKSTAENSDPEVLGKMAQASQGTGDAESLEEKRARVQSLLAEMQAWPTEAELLQQSLDRSHDKALPLVERLMAMKLLRDTPIKIGQPKP